MACPVMGWSPVTMITWHSLQARREGRNITLIPALLHSATAFGTVALGGSIMLKGGWLLQEGGGRREEGHLISPTSRSPVRGKLGSSSSVEKGKSVGKSPVLSSRSTKASTRSPMAARLSQVLW